MIKMVVKSTLAAMAKGLMWLFKQFLDVFKGIVIGVLINIFTVFNVDFSDNAMQSHSPELPLIVKVDKASVNFNRDIA